MNSPKLTLYLRGVSCGARQSRLVSGHGISVALWRGSEQAELDQARCEAGERLAAERPERRARLAAAGQAQHSIAALVAG